MPVIFISYRREDSAGHAGRLFDRLREQFGKDRVFLDVVGIEAGVDFVETIDKAVGSCDVLLAVIGREWLTCCDKQGRRRLDDPNDFIRAEISAALNRNVRVVPVLVEGAEMPPPDALPEELKRLTRRQAVELRDSRWDADVEALISALEREGGATPRPASAEPVRVEQERKSGRPALLWGIGTVIAALVSVGLFLFLKAQEPNPHKVRTPKLVGLSLDEALEKLRTSGLTAGRQQGQQSTAAPARQVLRQFPEAGQEIEPDSTVDLVYAESAPAQTSVTIYYANEANRVTAERLVDHLRGPSRRGISYTVLQSQTKRLEAGKVYYSEENASLAKTIADRSGDWLSKHYTRSVRIEAKLAPRIARTGLILTLPSSQGGSSRRPP